MFLALLPPSTSHFIRFFIRCVCTFFIVASSVRNLCPKKLHTILLHPNDTFVQNVFVWRSEHSIWFSVVYMVRAFRFAASNNECELRMHNNVQWNPCQSTGMSGLQSHRTHSLITNVINFSVFCPTVISHRQRKICFS